MDRDALAQAYRKTLYRVHLEGREVVLRVGVEAPELDAELARRGELTWAWLTAVNPRSERFGEPANLRRLAELDVALAAAGWRAVPGVAVDPDGRWPDEPSRLVFGAPSGAVEALAERFGQNAFLAGRRGEPVELHWCGGPASAAP